MIPTPETVKKEFADFVAGLGPNHPVGWATEEAIYRQIARDNALLENMWVTGGSDGSPSQWYAKLYNDLPYAGDHPATQSRGIFCVSKAN